MTTMNEEREDDEGKERETLEVKLGSIPFPMHHGRVRDPMDSYWTVQYQTHEGHDELFWAEWAAETVGKKAIFAKMNGEEYRASDEFAALQSEAREYLVNATGRLWLLAEHTAIQPEFGYGGWDSHFNSRYKRAWAVVEHLNEAFQTTTLPSKSAMTDYLVRHSIKKWENIRLERRPPLVNYNRAQDIVAGVLDLSLYGGISDTFGHYMRLIENAFEKFEKPEEEAERFVAEDHKR